MTESKIRGWQWICPTECPLFNEGVCVGPSSHHWLVSGPCREASRLASQPARQSQEEQVPLRWLWGFKAVKTLGCARLASLSSLSWSVNLSLCFSPSQISYLQSWHRLSTQLCIPALMHLVNNLIPSSQGCDSIPKLSPLLTYPRF